MPTHLLLMRHAATAGNLRKPYLIQGSLPDDDLAPDGVAQAHAAAFALSTIPLAAVYASPMVRARRTAEVIASAHRLTPTIDAGLIEADVGRWAGLTWEQIEATWPSEFAAFQRDGAVQGYLGGETMADVRDRVLPVVERIVAAHPNRTVLVVSHGVVNRALLTHWLGMPIGSARKLPQDNTGYNLVTFDGGHAKVKTINRADHLAGVRIAA